jgi:hypothetical protein
MLRLIRDMAQIGWYHRPRELPRPPKLLQLEGRAGTRRLIVQDVI